MRIGYSCGGWPSPYPPAEDTWQTMEAAEAAGAARLCVEIGAGSGVVARTACRSSSYVVLSDIDPCSVATLHGLLSHLVDVVQADNASWLRRGAGSLLVIFNTPYLPDACSGPEELQWCGGLREALRLLTSLAGCRSCILVVTFSSLSGSLKGFMEYAGWLGFRVVRVISRRLFFETLYTVVLGAECLEESPARACRH
ncbi:MAG: hypothetical protein GXO09_05520 [Crenarchaeota archaeon]|nr:hypothetical protein [Thermoproteota archaeon]